MQDDMTWCVYGTDRDTDCVVLAGSIRALSALPGVSIYTQLVANTLSFYLFALRIKQPRRVTGFVSHCSQAPLQVRFTTNTHS